MKIVGNGMSITRDPTYPKYNCWDRDINDFATKTQVQVAVNTFQCT